MTQAETDSPSFFDRMQQNMNTAQTVWNAVNMVSNQQTGSVEGEQEEQLSSSFASLPEANLSQSVVYHSERLSPYKNLFVFSSTVLLWHRPLVFAGFAIALHFFLWISGSILMNWNTWSFVGIVAAFLLVADYLCGLFHITWDRCLSFFPTRGDEQYSYEEIIEHYVTVRKYVMRHINEWSEFRQTQPQQFLVTALFFTLIICSVLSFFSVFLVVYITLFACLITPGLLHNDIPRRVYVFLHPHAINAYNVANSKIVEALKPTENTQNPQKESGSSCS